MSKKRRDELELIINDNDARRNGANKRKFHIKDLNNIQPITQTQKETFSAYNSNFNLFLYGSAGTGKTFLSMYLALRDILDKNTPYRRLIIVRSAVPTRDIGFLPGTEKEKLEIYELPYVSICNELFEYSKSYNNLKSGGYIDFISTSYLRGLTFDNAIILADECQNFDDSEFNTLVTRLGDNSRIIMCGDTKQKDLKNSAIEKNMKIFNGMESIAMVKFEIDDIVRSGIVREYLIAREKLD